MNTLQNSKCAVCQGDAVLLDVIDFHKTCGDSGSYFQGLSGIPIYYTMCKSCGFAQAPSIAAWSEMEFESKIYNADYYKVDPEFVEIRPNTNANKLKALFSDELHSLKHLDYGGGNGLLSEILNGSGWKSSCYDPYTNKGFDSAGLGKFDLITAFEVFEHVPDPIKLVTSIKSLLAPDGVIYFSTLLSDGNLGYGRRMDWWYAAPRNGHISLFSKLALQCLAQQFEFKLASNWFCDHAFFTNRPHWARRLIP